MSSRATQCVSVLDVSTDLDLALDDLACKNHHEVCKIEVE